MMLSCNFCTCRNWLIVSYYTCSNYSSCIFRSRTSWVQRSYLTTRWEGCNNRINEFWLPLEKYGQLDREKESLKTSEVVIRKDRHNTGKGTMTLTIRSGYHASTPFLHQRSLTPNMVHVQVFLRIIINLAIPIEREFLSAIIRIQWAALMGWVFRTVTSAQGIGINIVPLLSSNVTWSDYTQSDRSFPSTLFVLISNFIN